jgi:hypothetical protein
VTHWLSARGSYNAVEEIEKLGFTYVVDENENGDEIGEERSARPITADQVSLVSYLESTVSPDEHWLTLWRSETRLDDTPFSLWRRYFRAGNTQLKNLLLFGFRSGADWTASAACLPAWISLHAERTAGALRARL